MIKLIHNGKIEKLQWTTEHPASHYGLGVLLYENEDILDGFNFALLAQQGATILCDTELELRQIKNALATGANPESEKSIHVKSGGQDGTV